jgi:Tol biopolymer transport system component
MKRFFCCLLSIFIFSSCTFSLPRVKGEIAYISQEGNLYILNANGGTPRQITGDGLGYRHPVWSRDGERLAVLDRTGHAVLVASASGQRYHQIYHSQTEPPVNLAWSPDGQHLAFTSAAASGAYLLQIFSLHAESVQTVDAGRDLRWAWTEQGELLVRTPERQSRFDVDGRIIAEELFEPAVQPSSAGAGLYVGVPSPDGLAVAYFSQEDGKTILSIANPWTGLERRRYEVQPTFQTFDLLQRLERWQEGFRLWSPDSRYIVLAQQEASGSAIWIYPASGQEAPRRLVEGVEASWSWR